MTVSWMKAWLLAGSSNGLRYEPGSASTVGMGCKLETFDGINTSVLLEGPPRVGR